MDGLSRWDLVLWIVVAYVAVAALVRMMLNHRDAVMSKMRQRLAVEKGHKPAKPAVQPRREAA